MALRYSRSSGRGVATVLALGNLGATETVVLSAGGTLVEGTLDANCALTLTPDDDGADFILDIKQDGTGGRTLTLNGASIPVEAAADAVTTLTGYVTRSGTIRVFQSGTGYRVVSPGNLGAAYTLALTATDRDVLVIGTLNANCVVTPTGMTAGVSMTFLLTQDATGSRTFEFSPTSKKPAGSALGISTAASAKDVVSAFSPDGTAIYAMLAGKGMA